MLVVRMHEDQLEVSTPQVRALLADQFPSLAEREVRAVPTAATVNAIFRVGVDLAARFPLRALGPDRARVLLAGEAHAADRLAAVSPVPIPRPMAIGRPGHGYPSPWSLQAWLAGDDATVEDPAGSAAFAHDLAGFVAACRRDAASGRHTGHGRGGHLLHHDEWVQTCLRRSEDLLDVAPLRALWAGLRGLPEVDAHVMCHGDLTPPNVLVASGRLAGVLDCGGYAPADPALDLVAGWHLLDDERRSLLRDALGCGEVQWLRGMAWALQQAMGLVWYYRESNPTMARWGGRTLDRLAAHA